MNRLEEQAKEYLAKKGYSAMALTSITPEIMADFANPKVDSKGHRLDEPTDYDKFLEIEECKLDNRSGIGWSLEECNLGIPKQCKEYNDALYLSDWIEEANKKREELKKENRDLTRLSVLIDSSHVPGQQMIAMFKLKEYAESELQQAKEEIKQLKEGITNDSFWEDVSDELQLPQFHELTPNKISRIVQRMVKNLLKD